MKDQSNTNLHVSRSGKTDEFYTDISMVENELKHYREYFKDKIVFCNCDDPAMSNFWRYFQINFYMLGPEIFIDRNIMFMYLKKQPLRGLFLNGFEFQQGNRMSLSQK